MMSKIDEQKKFTRTALSFVAEINRERSIFTEGFKADGHVFKHDDGFKADSIYQSMSKLDRDSPNISPRREMNFKFSTYDLMQKSIEEC